MPHACPAPHAVSGALWCLCVLTQRSLRLNPPAKKEQKQEGRRRREANTAEHVSLADIGCRGLLHLPKNAPEAPPSSTARGLVSLHATHTPCISCLAVFCQFRAAFPGVALDVRFTEWRATRRALLRGRRRRGDQSLRPAGGACLGWHLSVDKSLDPRAPLETRPNPGQLWPNALSLPRVDAFERRFWQTRTKNAQTKNT